MNSLACSCCQKDIDERNLIKILNEERELTEAILSRLKKALEFKRQLTDGRLYLTLDTLITINNIITNSNNFQLRRVNVRSAGSDNGLLQHRACIIGANRHFQLRQNQIKDIR